MVQAWAGLEKYAADIRPDVMELFSVLGDEAIHAYAKEGLFHTTHSSFVDEIMTDGLRPNAEVIHPEDISFLTGLFTRYQPAKREGFEGSLFDREFLNYDSTQRGELARGVALWPDRRNIIGESWGLFGRPRILRNFLRNMNFVAHTPVFNGHPDPDVDGKPVVEFDEADRIQAEAILSTYLQELTGNPRLVLLAVDPFTPSIINSRRWESDEHTPLAQRYDALEQAGNALSTDGARDIDIRQPIPPGSLEVIKTVQVSPFEIVSDTERSGMIFLAPWMVKGL